MNHALESLAAEIGLADAGHERMRLEFGHACVQRVRHLLEDPEVELCVAVLGEYLAGHATAAQLQAAAEKAARLANHHPGSKSIDGCGHAAVSASYAVAKAVAGKALDAASYAAYATVYAQAGSAGVAARESFDPEFAWQASALQALAKREALKPTADNT
jgi:hypothetical protein